MWILPKMRCSFLTRPGRPALPWCLLPFASLPSRSLSFPRPSLMLLWAEAGVPCSLVWIQPLIAAGES